MISLGGLPKKRRDCRLAEEQRSCLDVELEPFQCLLRPLSRHSLGRGKAIGHVDLDDREVGGLEGNAIGNAHVAARILLALMSKPARDHQEMPQYRTQLPETGAATCGDDVTIRDELMPATPHDTSGPASLHACGAQCLIRGS